MSFDISRLSRISLALWSALFFGLAALILVLMAPRWLLERGVVDLGLDQWMRALTPPLGRKARFALAVVASGMTVAVITLPYALIQIFGARPKLPQFRSALGRPTRAYAPVASPIPATARRPIFADKELGAPLMSDAVLEKAQSAQWGAPAAWESETAHDPLPSSLLERPVAPPLDAASIPSDTPYESEEPMRAPDHLTKAPDSGGATLQAPAPVQTQTATPTPSKPFESYEELSLQDLIARLEHRLASRGSTPPPSAPTAQPAPNSEPVVQPITPPLTVVPKARSNWPENHIDDSDDSAGDALLREAMSKLNKLVGGAR